MTKTFQTLSPIDNSIYTERHYATQNDITKTLDALKKSQAIWRKTTIDDRIAYCQKARHYFITHKEKIAEEITWQMGRPITQTPGEINGMIERADYMISIAKTALADKTPAHRNSKERFIAREPLGSVFIIAPWNYPYLTAINSIIPALLAGNTVLLKHASQTPLCAERFAAAFKEAGLPEGVFEYLHIDYDSTAAIIKDPAINYVAFTGSAKGGHAIQAAANTRLISTGLELGGKDAAYVRADCTLNKTVDNLVDGAFFNAGQSCCGIERIYVHSKIYDDFLERFINKSKEYRLGNPTHADINMGPVVKNSAAQFIRQQIQDACSKGAVASTKDTALADNYLYPCVLHNVTHDMTIMTEETFGPAVGIMRVHNDNEALELMNDCKYGLTASIWTEDRDTGIALARSVKAGTLFINRCDYLDPALPWTGLKDSGNGYSLSTLGFDQVTQAKSFNIN